MTCDHFIQTGMPCATPGCANGPEGGIPNGYWQDGEDRMKWLRRLAPCPPGPSVWKWHPLDPSLPMVY